MTTAEMSTLLGIRLEDEDEKKFTESDKLKFLNNAETKLLNLLDIAYFTELNVLETELTATGGVYNISSLSNTVSRGEQGILNVKINNGKFCHQYNMSNQKLVENSYRAGSSTNPYFYIFQNKIYVVDGNTNPIIDVYYLKVPTELTILNTSDFNKSLHELVVGLAAAEGWMADAKPTRRQIALDDVFVEVKMLNEHYKIPTNKQQ